MTEQEDTESATEESEEKREEGEDTSVSNENKTNKFSLIVRENTQYLEITKTKKI